MVSMYLRNDLVVHLVPLTDVRRRLHFPAADSDALASFDAFD